MSITILTEDQAERIARTAATLAYEDAFSRFANPTPEVMTLPELCAYLKVSAPTVRERIKSKGLPVSHKLGDPRFIKKDIDNWLR